MADRDDLVEKFRTLGVNDPDSWAESQEREGVPQLTRATILAELAAIIDGAATAALAEQHLPSDRLSATLAAVRASGVQEEDLKTLLQFVGTLAVFEVCVLLDGAREIGHNPDRVCLSLAISHDDPDSGEDDMTFEPADLGLHESLGDVVTAKLGKDVYWN